MFKQKGRHAKGPEGRKGIEEAKGMVSVMYIEWEGSN